VTELQYGLIGLGVATLAGVLGYNKWQEYRHRKVAESVLKPHHEDVLLNKSQPVVVQDLDDEPVFHAVQPVERIEPVFLQTEPVWSAKTDPAPVEPVLVSKPAPAEHLHTRIEPEVAPVIIAPELKPDPKPEPTRPQTPPRPAPVQPAPVHVSGSDEAIIALPPELLDPRLEFIVSMELIEPVSARQILQSQRDALQKMSKPVHWVAFNERKREWEPLHSDSELQVRRLRIGLQLVNRLGPVSGGDLAIFSGAMQALADELMAVADMPPTRILDQAAEIDGFCAAVDLEIGLNLVSRGVRDAPRSPTPNTTACSRNCRRWRSGPRAAHPDSPDAALSAANARARRPGAGAPCVPMLSIRTETDTTAEAGRRAFDARVRREARVAGRGARRRSNTPPS
jgi:hypothetical protein